MSNPEIGKVGTFAIVPAGQAHFVWTLDEEAIVQLQVQDIEIGNIVNLKDDSFAMSELICSTPRATRRVFQTSQT